MSNLIGKVAATEKKPTTIDEFYFWTSTDLILNPFDVVKVEHVRNSITFGVIEEIFHITDSASYLTNFISNDFGDVNVSSNTERIGMNFVKAKFVRNTQNIYIPVKNESKVFLATKEEVAEALGLNNVKNPVVCGCLEMYEGAEHEKDKVRLPVHLNADFLIGPEGAHLNISGISGLAAKTSYAMFLLKSIQDKSLTDEDFSDVAFVFLNVKGKDLLSIDKKSESDFKKLKIAYENLGLNSEPFKNVKYFYPYDKNDAGTYGKELLEEQLTGNKAFRYKFLYEYDRDNLDLLFSNIDDPNQTMDSIVNYIMSEQGNFKQCTNWEAFLEEVDRKCQSGGQGDKEITVASWRKFKRIIKKSLNAKIFANRLVENNKEVRLQDKIKNIQAHDVYVIDIAKQEENMQAFIFGNVMRTIYDLKLGEFDDDIEKNPPKRIVVFIDELNKYASSDIPKNSPILRQILDVAERGRSLGIILFAAEQFRSAIHDRVTGNCATHAYGRTNSIEISKKDYNFIPQVYKNMMTRLKQGEYIIQNPMFNSLLNIKFPEPIYKQHK